jgi:hypothetical protein
LIYADLPFTTNKQEMQIATIEGDDTILIVLGLARFQTSLRFAELLIKLE